MEWTEAIARALAVERFGKVHRSAFTCLDRAFHVTGPDPGSLGPGDVDPAVSGSPRGAGREHAGRQAGDAAGAPGIGAPVELEVVDRRGGRRAELVGEGFQDLAAA